MSGGDKTQIAVSAAAGSVALWDKFIAILPTLVLLVAFIVPIVSFLTSQYWRWREVRAIEKRSE
jgi:Zn-dependent protease with chaperone function